MRIAAHAGWPALALPLLFLSLASSVAAAADGHAVVVVHEASPTAIKDDVRSVTQARDGSLLVGSNVLAAFDGTQWQPIDVPHAYGFRALAPATGLRQRNRVWVGAIGAIGFVERDASSSAWHYRSLLPEVSRAGLSDIGDVWNVRALGKGAVWITTEYALRWTPDETGGGRFELWHLPARSRLSAFGGGDTVWIHQEGTGLLRLQADGPPAVAIDDARLHHAPVTWLLPLDTSPKSALLGLQDTAYRWTEGRALERLDALSAALESTLPTDAVALEDERIAIATFKQGIVIATREGTPVALYSTDRGLADKSIYSMWAAADRLWLASPRGLTRIDGVGRAEWFERHRALDDGRPLAAVEHGGNAYVLASSALLREEPTGLESIHRLEPALSAPGVFLDAQAIAGELWISGFGGIWRIAGGQSAQEYFVSNDVPRLHATARIPPGVVFLEGYFLKALVPSPRGWAVRALGASIPDWPVSLHEDTAGQLWVSTMTLGVIRFRWDETASPDAPRLRPAKAYRPRAGLPPDAGRVELVPIGNRLHAFTDAGILTLRDDQLGFDAVPELSSYHGIAATRAASDAGPTHSYLLVQSSALQSLGEFAVIRVEPRDNGSLSIREIHVPGLDHAGPLTTIGFAGGALWVGGNRGLLRIDAATLAPAAPPPTPRLLATAADADAGTFHFRFVVPSAANGEKYFYQTRLSDVDSDWSPPQEDPERHLAGLAPGAYRFEARTLDRFGRASEAVAHSFVVLAPWWKTARAFAAYTVLLVALVLGLARWKVARLRRQNRRLNELVAERTREIELVSTAKSEFLENVSHEIRNPLNGLTGLLALLKEERLDPRERELARSLKSVAGTLTQVFEEVLQFSKLEYGYGRIERQPFALRPVLEEVIALFAEPARQAGCPLALSWPDGLADGFEGDAVKIKTIVSNFVGNALKYAPGAPVDVRVEATGETDGMVDLYVDVVDHGPGVPPEEQELIFKKFVRGRHAQQSKVAGTGLGLATCRVLAKLMNASVGIDGTPGGGATFHLKLLLPRAPSPDVLAPGGAAPATSIAGPMLIVEDEPYNRVVLEGIAWELGCIADSAASAEEARQWLATRDYAVVFLDWELPDGKGGDIATALRARPGESRPVVLATTAHDSDEIRRRCRDSGMDGFLLKPYNAAKVRQAIAEVTALRAGQKLNGESPPHSPSRAADRDPGSLDLTAFEHYTRLHAGTADDARERYVEALDSHSVMIAEAVSAGNIEAISRQAHQLRALSGIVQAVDLNRAAARLEELARQGRTAQCAPAWAATKEACDALKARLG